MKNFSVTKGDENSVFVYSSAFEGNFVNMPKVDDDMIVVITNAHSPVVTVYENDTERMAIVKEHCRYITTGCNYTYECVRKTGNCYFCN